MGATKIRADTTYGYIDSNSSVVRLNPSNNSMNVWNGSSWNDQILTEKRYTDNVYDDLVTFSIAVSSFSSDVICDSSGNLYWAVANYYDGVTYNLTSYVYKITPSGTRTVFASQSLTAATGTALAFDSSGNLYWALVPQVNSSTGYVFKITSGGTKTTFASQTCNGTNDTALVFDSSGNLYWAVANSNDGADWTTARTSYVYKITSGGTLTTFASQSMLGGRGTDLVFDSSGNLYWSLGSHYNGTTYDLTTYLYKITSGGTKTTFASNSSFGVNSAALAIDSSNNIYWSFNNYRSISGNHSFTSVLYKITSGGAQSTFGYFFGIATLGVDLLIDSNNDLYWAISCGHNGHNYNGSMHLFKILSNGTRIPLHSSLIRSHNSRIAICFNASGDIFCSVSPYRNDDTFNCTTPLYIKRKAQL